MKMKEGKKYLRKVTKWFEFWKKNWWVNTHIIVFENVHIICKNNITFSNVGVFDTCIFEGFDKGPVIDMGSSPSKFKIKINW